MTDEYTALDIKPLLRPNDPTRQAILAAYRQGLAENPGVAWNAALRVMRERFPLQDDVFLRRSLLLTLGLFSIENREEFARGNAPNTLGNYPCFLSNGIGMRVADSAKIYGISVDELVSRLVAAWLETACDFDGIPFPGTKVP